LELTTEAKPKPESADGPCDVQVQAITFVVFFLNALLLCWGTNDQRVGCVARGGPRAALHVCGYVRVRVCVHVCMCVPQAKGNQAATVMKRRSPTAWHGCDWR